MEVLTRLGKINSVNLVELKQLCLEYERKMFPSNNYAPQRREVHIRRFVRLPKTRNDMPKVDLISEKLGGKYIIQFRDIERVEALGDRLLPGFHQGIMMFYPSGANMKRHRDHWIYAKGAAQVNVSGNAVFTLNGLDYALTDGDCIGFDNTLPHSVRAESDRWAICFFKLKPKYLAR